MKERLLYRIGDLQRVVGLSKTSIYALIKEGDFPMPLQITSRSVAWKASDVAEWVNSRPTSENVTATSETKSTSHLGAQ